MRPSYCTPRGTDICEINAGRGGEGAGAGAGGCAILAARAAKLFCAAWMEERAMCEIDCERSCGRLRGWPGGAKVGVLAVVKARVVVDVFGWENDTRASSLPSQHCSVGL